MSIKIDICDILKQKLLQPELQGNNVHENCFVDVGD